MAASFIGGIAISTMALYFAFRNVPFIELFEYLASINYLWVLPAVLVTLFSFFLRAVRWQIILDSAKKIGVMRAFHPMMIGFMINCVLPGRLGEVVRPVLLHKKESVPFTTGLATVVAERVFDIFLLILLFMLTAGMLQIDPTQNVGSGKYQLNQETLQAVFDGMLRLGLLLIFGMVLFSIGKIREMMYRSIMTMPELFFFAGQRFKSTMSQRICEPVVNILKNIAQGFALIRYPKKLVLCMFYSSLVWGFQALSYYLLSLGSPGIDLTFFEIATMLVIICFFISLPSVPGWWGLWEAGGVFALSLFGVSGQEAAGYTLANHALQVFPVIIAGLLSAMILSVNIRQMSYESKKYRQNQPGGEF
jgi:uncharacterized protein (TIRG00374 family)